MSSSSSVSSDFYSDLTINGVEGGSENNGVYKLLYGIIIVAVIILILGITLWQLESNSIITYSNPTATEWLSKGLMILGGSVLAITIGGTAYSKFKKTQP